MHLPQVLTEDYDTPSCEFSQIFTEKKKFHFFRNDKIIKQYLKFKLLSYQFFRLSASKNV